MTSRIEKILEGYKTFNRNTRKRLVAGNFLDYFMQEFRGELATMYQDTAKDEIRNDIKDMADMIYQEEDREKREFLVNVLLDIVKMM